MTHAGGRPSDYSVELVELICNRIADGESLRDIGLDDAMPSRETMRRWLISHEEFRAQYALAREEQAEFYADEIIKIADDGSNDTYTDDDGNVCTNHDVIARSRLRVDARKWHASKLAPKKYGDKLAVGGADDLPALKIESIERVIIDPK